MGRINCSGYTIDGPVRDILDAGAQRFIQKPFSISPFAEKLKEVLEGKWVIRHFGFLVSLIEGFLEFPKAKKQMAAKPKR